MGIFKVPRCVGLKTLILKPMEKLNLTSTTDFSYKTLCIVFFGAPCRSPDGDKNIFDHLGPYKSFSRVERYGHASVVMPGDVIILIGGHPQKHKPHKRRRRSIMEPNLMEGPVPPKAENTAVGLHPTEGVFAGEQILFCPQNKNTNKFGSKRKKRI